MKFGKGKLLVAFALITGGVATVNTVGIPATYSDGDRVGVVTKISHKGIVFKSWEGELAMDGFNKAANGSTTNVFAFTVKDEAIVKQIQDAQENGDRVKLHYREVLVNGSWTADTPYRIDQVEVMKNDNNSTPKP